MTMAARVGLVVVSHSRALAEAVARLAMAVGQGPLPIAFAGGVGDAHDALGTDATDILDAMLRVDSAAGVLVLADLGGALLAAETALELAEGQLAGPARLVAAPLVEGAVAAAVQIGLGADLDTVAREALGALAPKQAQLAGGDAAAPPSPAAPSAAVQQVTDGAEPPGIRERFRIDIDHGLHLRPAAALVATIGRFGATAWLRRADAPGAWGDARSLNAIATLGIDRGDVIEMTADGADAPALLAAVRALVARGFGEAGRTPAADAAGGPAATPPGDLPAASAGTGAILTGMPAAPGLAVGTLAVLAAASVLVDAGDPPVRSAPLAEAEVEAALEPVRAALGRVGARLREQSRAARARARGDAAGIAEAQAAVLADPALETGVRALLRDRVCDAVTAFRLVAARLAAGYRALADAYQRARAADVEDAAGQVLALLARAPEPAPGTLAALPAGAILVVDKLTTSQALALDPARVAGVASARGSRDAHAAIIVRGLGLPMVTGLALPAGGSRLDGVAAVLDGDAGTLEPAPGPARLAAARARLAEAARAAAALRERPRQPGVLADGSPLPVQASVASAADARAAAAGGAQGIGLLRTELALLDAEQVPDEDAQVARLAPILAAFPETGADDRPPRLRLFDIGGDKPLRALALPVEANPFLGLRGVRLLADPAFHALRDTQLRALLRAGAGRRIGIMIPMVATAAEIDAIRAALAGAHADLARAGVAHAWPLQLGIMVETPAAALAAPQLAARCDYFSLGTNDLTQYVMAAERGNAAVTGLADGLHPAVLRAVALTCDAARAAGIPVGVCGELGADPLAIPLLIGLGVGELSVHPAAVPVVKARLAGLYPAACRALAERALGCTDAAAVRALVLAMDGRTD